MIAIRAAQSILAAIGLCFLAVGCSSYTTLPLEVRTKLDESYRGKVLALKVSASYGPLYDDNERLLLDQWPFSEASHILDLDGKPIHPEGQQGIIPYGTRFIVQKIESPDKSALFKRMLVTPRYNPWVFLKLADSDNLFLPITDKPFVLVLPPEMKTEAKVRQALEAFLGNVKQVNTWLKARDPQVAIAIKHKEARPGMTIEELVASWGYPTKSSTRKDSAPDSGRDRGKEVGKGDLARGSTIQVLEYGTRRVELVGGKVLRAIIPTDQPDQNPPAQAPGARQPNAATPSD